MALQLINLTYYEMIGLPLHSVDTRAVDIDGVAEVSLGSLEAPVELVSIIEPGIFFYQ